ncbi:MAG: ABC transporter permease [Spirochaetaceae bacterium]|jgi:simple sugar transport system permease protein|nr:ABC transporter permease [Spirochaetaceae bacterium]
MVESIFNYTLIHAALRLSTPILMAALAVIISQQAGVLNLAVEGCMTLGAFMAICISYLTMNWFAALTASVIIGLLVSIVVGIAHIKFKADIFAVGMTINIFAVAITNFLLSALFNVTGSFIPDKLASLPRLTIGFLEKKPVLNSIISGYSFFEIGAILMVFMLHFFLFKTSQGLRLRSVGLNELAAETAGINIDKTKFAALLFSGIVGGMAGAHLSLGYTNFFTPGMVSGRGFMGIAAMFFSGGYPIISWLACLLFGLIDSIGSRLQAYGLPAQFILMLPYVTTICVLVLSMWRRIRKNRRLSSSLTAPGELYGRQK